MALPKTVKAEAVAFFTSKIQTPVWGLYLLMMFYMILGVVIGAFAR